MCQDETITALCDTVRVHRVSLDSPTTQTEQDVAKARAATLPPLQSVVELTSAAAPPSRNAEEMGSVSSAGKVLMTALAILPS